MAGDAEVKLKFVSDEKALASMEQRLAAVTAKLDAMAAAGKKAGQTKVDPFAARMTSGATGDAGIAAMMTRAGLQQAHSKRLDFLKGELSLIDQQLDRRTRLMRLEGGLNRAGQVVGAGLVAAGVAALNATGNKARTQAEDVSQSQFTMGELETKLQTQAGLSRPDALRRIATVAQVLQQTPTISTLAGGTEMQTWLESAGLNQKDVASGKMLAGVTEGLAALNAYGKDKGFTSDKEAVRSVVGSVKAFGMEGDYANLMRMQNVLAMGFKETSMEAQHIPSFVKSAPALAGAGVTPEQGLGVFSGLVSSGTPAESAGRAMEAYVSRLFDVKAGQERDQALGNIGLTQADVVVTKGGNTIFQSMDRIASALEGRTETEKGSFLAQMFGADSGAEIQMMLRDRAEMKRKSGLYSDTTALKEAVVTTRESGMSQRNRASLRSQTADWVQSISSDYSWGSLEKELESRYKSKYAAAETATGRLAASAEATAIDFGAWVAKGIGMSPDYVAGVEATQESKELLKEIRDLLSEKNPWLKEPPSKNRNGNIERDAGGGTMGSY